eukprot:TRINITY_DN39348_c0_g1_i1.p1 TRINITY_DN39348_c0_g1~~TRINITY_DN39348_c0_g1_i1.p1  ORF type:complete len:491 (+),score=105.17 TRINITY_DN39348_c0_g1_i1:127-1473(+)
MAVVELVHPTVLRLRGEGIIDDENVMTESVMKANLMLFKTVIAGDGWGSIAVPVIMESPATAIIFIMSQLTLVFGVLNLVVAVVVDTFAEKRQKDIEKLAEDLENDEATDVKILEKIFEQIDEDHSGELSLDELLNGARKIPEFQSRLRVMDIDQQDLEQLFYMLDQDSGGSIDPSEFINALSRWIHESKTATRFVKYNVEKLVQGQMDLASEVRSMKRKMETLQGGRRKMTTQTRLEDLMNSERFKALQKEYRSESAEETGNAAPAAPVTTGIPSGEDAPIPPEFEHGSVNSAAGPMAFESIDKINVEVQELFSFDEALRSALRDMKAEAVKNRQLASEAADKRLLESLKLLEEEIKLSLDSAPFRRTASPLPPLPKSQRFVRLSSAKWGRNGSKQRVEGERKAEVVVQEISLHPRGPAHQVSSSQPDHGGDTEAEDEGYMEEPAFV